MARKPREEVVEDMEEGMGGRTAELLRLSDAADRADQTLTAEGVLEASKDGLRYPALHAYVWSKSVEELARERQLQMCHQLIISVKIRTVTDLPQRYFVHVRREQPGYRPVERVASVYDLASQKLEQLSDDITRSRMRLTAFRSMLPDEVTDRIEAALEEAQAAIRETLERRRREAPPAAEAS